MNVIISGATKGIGRAIAEGFAQEGANLAICARNKADLKAFKKYLLQKHPSIEVLEMEVDVSKKKDVLAFAEMILKNWQKIDVLINNAGQFLPGVLYQEPDGVLEQLINTNLYSAYYLTKALIPAFLEQGSGHIFNMCSVASIKALPNSGSYCISKFALLGFSKSLREELMDKGIKVTSILPGATWSDSWAGVDLPKERLMEAKDIADSVLACCKLGNSAVIEEIIIRPQLGDL